MNTQIKKRLLSFFVCFALICALSSFACAANDSLPKIDRDIIREGENLIPDTDNGDVGEGIVPTPDETVPAPDDTPDETPEILPDKENAKPDEGHDVTKDNEESGRKFNYTGLIIAIIIALAAVILTLIMIPSCSKRDCSKTKK